MKGSSLIWMPQNYDAHKLHRELVRIFGPILIALWIGEDIQFDGNNRITSWPGRIGPTLTPEVAGVLYPTRCIRNGRVGIINNENIAAKTAFGSLLSVAPQSMWTVALSNEVPIVDSYNVLIRGKPYGTTDSTWLVCDAVGQSRFYNGSYGTIYADAIKTFSLDSNLHVYSNDYAANTVAGISIFGYDSTGGIPGGGGWQGEAYLFMCLSAPATPLQRAQATVAIKRYYGLVPTLDELKAATVPVAGAVVIAPLQTALQSYGSLNSAFTVAGAPVVTSNGTTFDGADDLVYLTTGASANWSFIANIKLSSTAFLERYALACDQTIPTGDGVSLMAQTYGFPNSWCLRPIYLATTQSTQLTDTNWHTVAMINTGSNTELYFDGVLVATQIGNTTAGTGGLVFGGVFYAAGTPLFKDCTIRNSLLFHSALPNPERITLEAWTAAATL